MTGPVFAPSLASGATPTITLRRVGHEAQPVLILDGLLTGAEALVDFAVEQAVLAPVKAAANFYPGVRAPCPGGYVQALVTALRPHLAEVFAAPPGCRAHVTSALSMAVLPAAEANLPQRLPHIDTSDPCQLAILHYLCEPAHGGTAFYRHRATGFETVGPDRAQPYFAALRAELDQGPPDGGYISNSNSMFEQTQAVDVVFNRVVVYPSNLLHAGMLPDVPLSTDPRAGRLTANTFFRFEA